MKERQHFKEWCWISWRSVCRKMQIDAFLSPCTKLKSKWIKDLHIKPDTLKLIEKKLGKRLEHMGTGKYFLNRTSIADTLRSRIDKWDLIKLQSFFFKAKDTVNRTKWQPIDWETFSFLNLLFIYFFYTPDFILLPVNPLIIPHPIPPPAPLSP